MKNVTWIIQKNLTSELDRWKDALEDCGSIHKEITIIPFSDEVPEVEYETPYAVAHGSTTIIKGAPKRNWNPGIFFTPEHFEPSTWCNVYGRHFLNWNHDGFMMLKDVDIPKGEKMFVRPNGDLKDFSGSVVTKEGWDEFKKSVQEGGWPFNDELIVCCVPYRKLAEEYRLFIVNGNIVSSTKYRTGTMLDKKPGIPSDVHFFGQKMAHIWSPEKAYVMDVCRIENGNLHLLELNCFNASGTYAAPLEPVIKAVEKLFK